MGWCWKVNPLRRDDGFGEIPGYSQSWTSRLRAEIKRKELTFMQDNASCHTSRETKEFFKKQKFEPMFWPPSSSDLNPIENIWSVLKQGLWKRRSEIKNTDDTWRITQKSWYELPGELIKKINRSLPKRCERVSALQGQIIKTH